MQDARCNIPWARWRKLVSPCLEFGAVFAARPPGGSSGEPLHLDLPAFGAGLVIVVVRLDGRLRRMEWCLFHHGYLSHLMKGAYRCPINPRFPSRVMRDRPIGIRSADFIMALDLCAASSEAEHMTAPDPNAVLVIFSLHPGGRPQIPNVG